MMRVRRIAEVAIGGGICVREKRKRHSLLAVSPVGAKIGSSIDLH